MNTKDKKQPIKKVVAVMRSHLVATWAIISCLFALIIHILFEIPAPNEWFEPEWEAGDFLTYASTVALGLLAIWQNQKFKEENDAAQTRMENMSNRANELAVVSKVVEHETEKISTLKIKVQCFIDACNTEGILDDLADVANQPSDFMTTYVKLKMDSRDKQIRLCSIELLSELSSYQDEEKTIDLIRTISSYSDRAIALVKAVRTSAPIEEAAKEKADIERAFFTSIYSFISERESLLNKVIYCDLSLGQIKAMYQKEDHSNGKNENGVG